MYMYVYGVYVCVCVRCMCIYIYAQHTDNGFKLQRCRLMQTLCSLFWLGTWLRGAVEPEELEWKPHPVVWGKEHFFVYSNLGHLLCLILSSVRWHGMSKIGSVSSSRHIMQWLTNHRNESEVCVAGWHHHPWSEYNLGWRRLERSSNKTWENMSVFEKS